MLWPPFFSAKKHPLNHSTDAAPSDDGLSYALSRAGFATEKVVTAATLGSDASGHTSYSIVFERPFTMNATATAADTTRTAVGTYADWVPALHDPRR